MIVHGIHHHVAMKRLAAGELARQAQHPKTDPRDAYEKGVEADRLVKQAEELAAHAKGNDEAMENLVKILHYLATSPHSKGSRYRALAMTNLEQTIMWLHRENGDPEEVPIYQPEPPVNGHAKH